jgi:small subunit ribosomal protein S1
MTYRPEDLELDEGYWRALLEEAEHLPIAVTRSRAPGPATNAHTTQSTQGRDLRDSRENRESRDHLRPPAEHHAGAAAYDVSSSDHKIWNSLHEAMAHESLLEVEVSGCNRGGLIVHYGNLRGFIPSSHLNIVTLDMDEPARRTALANHIGHKLHVRVIELEPEQSRVVFSERASREPDPQPHEFPQILREIKVGETRRGHVTNLTAFGAFVDLGGYEGLVHVSELSWSRVNHPRDLLRIGDEVDVYVMSVAPEEGRIALSLKRARANPWNGIEQRYHVGQVVHGTVTNVVQFGAFVKVEDDLEGLVHVSELAEGSFMHPRNIVHEGDAVTARVIGVDSHSRRLALSLRDVHHGQ